MKTIYPNTIFVSLLFASLMIIATSRSSPAQHRDQPRQHKERYRILVKKGERKLYLYVWENGKERDEIKELFEMIPVKTPVKIIP